MIAVRRVLRRERRHAGRRVSSAAWDVAFMRTEAGAWYNRGVSVSAGDRVHVPGLGTGVVLEVRNHGRCLVEIRGRAVEVRVAQVEVVAPEGGTGRSLGRRAAGGGEPRRDAGLAPRGPVPASLDLHGSTVDEAVEALDAFLNDALLAGHAEVRVIHGRSGGRVKAATHARLRALTVVRAFRVDERNAGVTIVTL